MDNDENNNIDGNTGIERSSEELRRPPQHIARGTAGALLGALISVVLLILAGYSSSTMIFSFGVVFSAILPILMYELFSKDDLSAVQLIISGCITMASTFIGYRLSWAIPIYTAYKDEYDITFMTAYKSVYSCVQDGIIDAGQYWFETVICFGAVAVIYVMAFRMWSKGVKSFSKGLATKRR